MLLSKQNMTVLLMVMSTCLVFTTAKPTIDYCKTCLSVSEFIQGMEQNQTESIMKHNLYKMCLKENEGKNEKMCTFIATAIQNTLKYIGDEDFCSKINACPSTKAFTKPVTINEERCGFCSDLVDSFRAVNVGLDYVSDSLSSYCELTGDYQEECLENLNSNFMNFVDFVQNKMDSQTFCHAIQSCHYQTVEEKKSPSMGDLVALRNPIQMASHLDFLEENDKLSNADAKPYGALSCIVCRQVIVMVYASLHKNSTREHVEKLLAKSCKAIYFRNKEKERECESKVVKNAEIVLNGFINKVPPELVCLLSGMCIPGVADFNRNEIPSSPRVEVGIVEPFNPFEKEPNKDVGIIPDKVKCFMCEKIVQFLFKELDGKKTREEIKNLLDTACERLFKDGERQDKCEEYVNAYTDKLIDLIEKAGHPGIICNTLHLCPIKPELVAAYDAKKLDSTIDKEPFVVVQAEAKKPAYKIDWCRVCTVSYPWLNKAMQIDTVKDRIVQGAHDFCEASALPIPVESCNTKVDQYLEVIRTVKDTNTGCQQIKLCPAGEKNEGLVNFDIDLSIIETNSDGKLKNFGWWDDAKCTGCKLIIKGLYMNLNKTIHSPNTRKLIEKTCDHIPEDNLREKCIKDAETALETLYKDLTEKMNPEQACEMMNYCKKKEGDYERPNLKPLLQSSACNTCKGIIYPYFHKALQDENVKKTVKSILSKICDHSNKVEYCKSTTSKFIDDLASSETSEEGCQLLCKPDESLFTSTKASECTVCQATMVGLSEVFSNDRVKSKLNSTLENFCHERANENVKSKCRTLVRENLPRFYELIEKATDHDHGLCNSMGFCPSSNEDLVVVDVISNSADIKENYDLYSSLESNLKLLPNADDLLDEGLIKTNDNAVCDNCRKIFSKLEADIRNKRDFKDKLLQKLLETCPQKDDKCRVFYKKYINFIYESLLRNANPDRACPALKLCKVNLELPEFGDIPFEPALNLTESTVCKECHSALEYLKTTLNNKEVISFLMKEVEQNVCQPLNFIERKACNRLVSKFGPKIIAHFAQRIDKEKICTNKLKLCEEGEEVMIANDDAFDNFEYELIDFIEDKNCLLCTQTINKLNDIRGDSQRQVSIDEICSEEDFDCRKFMVDFQDFFVKGDHNVDSLVACSELDICLAPGRVQLLGGKEKCAYGPSYWCLSASHAEACDSADFCKNNVWRTISVAN